MTIEIHGRGIEPTPAIRQYALRRVTKLQRRHAGLQAATVVCRKDGYSQGVEVRVQGNGFVLFCRERGRDLYALLDRVIGKIARQIDGRLDRTHRFGNRRGQHRTHRVVTDTSDAPRSVGGGVRITPLGIDRYPAKPMTLEEALTQLSQAGAPLLPFRCADTGEVQVVYRRPTDGTVRLLIPEA